MSKASILSFVSEFSEQFDHINKDVVLRIRQEDDIAKYIDETCKELSKVLPQNIKYLGWEYDDRYRRNKEVNMTKDSFGKERLNIINTDFTFSRTATFRFRIQLKVQEEELSQIVYVPIYIPQLIDDCHYFIRGTKYYAPLQIIDGVTYTNNKDSVVIKTLIRTINLFKKKVTIKDCYGQTYNLSGYVLKMTKETPMVLYWFAYFGFFRTLRYFGIDNFIKFYDEAPSSEVESNDRHYFKFGTFYLGVEKDRFNQDIKLRELIGTIFMLNRRNLSLDFIRSPEYWNNVLGQVISDKNSAEKGESLLRTFITSLDHRTKNNLHTFFGGDQKETTFSVVRWMFLNFERLSAKSNTLHNKRVRLGEYLITPFIKRVYGKLWQFINASNKDFNKLQDIFKVTPAIIINAIIGKTRSQLSLNIAHHSAPVNDLWIINAGVKTTKGGPNSPMEGKTKLLGDRYRNYDASYVGRISCIATSTSDPGISGGTINPMSEFDYDNMTFYPVGDKEN